MAQTALSILGPFEACHDLGLAIHKVCPVILLSQLLKYEHAEQRTPPDTHYLGGLLLQSKSSYEPVPWHSAGMSSLSLGGGGGVGVSCLPSKTVAPVSIPGGSIKFLLLQFL